MNLLAFLVLAGCGPKLSAGSGAPGLGESCVERDCASGLICDHDGVCALPGDVGTAGTGGDCSDTRECAWELVCSGDNRCAEPGSEGTAGVGESCVEDADCEANHHCEAGACVETGVPWWEGGACPADDLESAFFYALFDVPNLPSTLELDFFSLPFPNDYRLDASGRPDLSGFPTPDGVDTVQALLDGVSGETRGWGLNPTVWFRFSRPQDTSTLTALTDGATIHWASLDPDAPDYGERSSLRFYTSTSRGRYVCQNWLAVSTFEGEPLLPDTTYAVWLTRDVRSQDGLDLTRDDGFKVMLQDTRPEDLGLAQAWDRYQPLRDYLAAGMANADAVVVAAVFTTGDASDVVRGVQDVAEDDAVVAADLAVRDLVACDTTPGGPCETDGGGGCPVSPDAAFAEVQGVVSLPAFGDASGHSAWDSADRPAVQGVTDACLSITLPRGEMPAGGWPVALVVPEGGASFRAPAEDGTAAALAAKGVATVSVALPGGGTLRADDPAALRTAAAELAAHPVLLARFAGAVDWDAAASPTGAALRLDPDQVWVWGTGIAAAPGVGSVAWLREPRGVVLGNVPGSWRHLLPQASATKYDLQVALADAALQPWHPLVSLLQQWMDPFDPVNHGLGLVREPATEAKHALWVHGVEDEVVPAIALESALRATELPTVGPVRDDYGQSTVGSPAEENVSTEDGRRTAGVTQWAAGHDALTTAALESAAGFVGTGVTGAPVITAD